MKFDHVTLLTDQFSALLNFYRVLPGVRVKAPSTAGYAEIVVGEGVFGVFDAARLQAVAGVPGPGPRGGSVTVQVSVNDIDTVATALTEKGVDIGRGVQEMPWGCKSLYITDPDRNLVEFYEW